MNSTEIQIALKSTKKHLVYEIFEFIKQAFLLMKLILSNQIIPLTNSKEYEKNLSSRS
jgi:hypothetical protein